MDNLKVIKGEFKIDSLKIYYCICGFRQFAVVDSDIDKKEFLIISARRVFAIDIMPPKVRGLYGRMVADVTLTSMMDVRMNCSFINRMSEDDPLYKGIIEQLSKLDKEPK